MSDLALNAYVLLAEPEWLELSVQSYYPLVRKIVASYDKQGRGWAGGPIRVDECIERLRAIDDDNKVEFVSGEYSAPGDPMANDTLQRKEAMCRADTGADWVLQIDTDEVVPATDPFIAALAKASRGDWDVFRYPNRVIRQHIEGDLYLEECTRLWLPLAATLPLALRAGTVPTWSREARGRAFRVGLHRSKVFSRPGRRPHATVSVDAALIHLSWVRSTEGMREKIESWGHSHDRNWQPILGAWERARLRPWRAVLATPASRVPFVGQLRRARLPGVGSPRW